MYEMSEVLGLVGGGVWGLVGAGFCEYIYQDVVLLDWGLALCAFSCGGYVGLSVCLLGPSCLHRVDRDAILRGDFHLERWWTVARVIVGMSRWSEVLVAVFRVLVR